MDMPSAAACLQVRRRRHGVTEVPVLPGPVIRFQAVLGRCVVATPMWRSRDRGEPVRGDEAVLGMSLSGPSRWPAVQAGRECLLPGGLAVSGQSMVSSSMRRRSRRCSGMCVDGCHWDAAVCVGSALSCLP